MQTITTSRSSSSRPSPSGPPAPASRGRKTLRALAAESGQGTVEYVGLLLLMASVLAGVVAAAGNLGGKEHIGDKVVEQIGKSIDETSKKK